MQEEITKEKDILKNSDDLMNVLMKDPEFLNLFVNKIRKIEKSYSKGN